jgi:hypothetical protein
MLKVVNEGGIAEKIRAVLVVLCCDPLDSFLQNPRAARIFFRRWSISQIGRSETRFFHIGSSEIPGEHQDPFKNAWNDSKRRERIWTYACVMSALHQFETQLGERVFHRLSPSTQKKLDALLAGEESAEDDAQTSEPPESGQAVLHDLRADPGRASLDNLLREMTRLERVRDLDLPLDGPAGALGQKPTVSPNKKTSRWPNSLILISEMGFLIDFRPEMTSERRAR